MLQKLRSLFKSNKKQTHLYPAHLCDEPLPQQIHLTQQLTLPIHLWTKTNEPFTIIDWAQAYTWIDNNLPPELQSQADLKCQKHWLLQLRNNFIQRTPNYSLWESPNSFILSPLDQHIALAALTFIDKAKKRIQHTLGDIAAPEQTTMKDIAIICDNADDYYQYIMQYFPEHEETIPSSGIFIHHGQKHFVTMDTDLSLIEPVIIHELTHSCLSHLPLPLWLNEGIAVSTEHHLAGKPPPEYTLNQMHHMHANYWTTHTIQEFWFGQSFHTTASSNLAYDLASNIVQLLGKNWSQFAQFTLQAHIDDAGTSAAQNHFNFTLGQCACIFLDQPYHPDWEPQPLAQ